MILITLPTLKVSTGEDAPAVGWITDVFIKPNKGIWATVEWTDHGKWLIESRSYRYISPVFSHKEDKVILHLDRAALTNNPNLKIKALNHTQPQKPTHLPQPQGESMNKVIKALALAAASSEEDVVAAINQLQSDKESAETEAERAKTALNNATPSPSDFVPKADYDQVVQARNAIQSELDEYQKTAHAEKQKAALDKALADGKISPASREYHAMNTQTPEGLKAFEEQYLPNTPVIAPNSGLPNAEPGVTTTLNTEEAYAARALGMTAEEYLKAKQEK